MNSIFGQMIRILFLCSLCTPLFLLTGCWDRTEVNDLALITAAAIDKGAGKSVELSVQVYIPKSSGGQGMTDGQGSGSSGSGGLTFVSSAEGITISDAMFKLQEKLPRLIFWGHTEIFIIGSELAKEGIRSNIDFMVRHPEVRENAYIFISKKKAKRILELIPPLERSSSEVLRGQVKSGIGVNVTLKDLVQRLEGDEEAANLPWVEEMPPEPGKKSLETFPYINGTAVIKEDKMVGHVNDKITSGVLWLRNEIHSLIITVSPKEAKGLVSLRLLKGHTQLIPKIENERWKITLKAESETVIMQNGTNMALMNPKYSEKIEKDVEDDIQESVQQALDHVQIKMKADIFDFADAFHRKYPKQWNKEKDRWDELFPKVEVSYDIKTKIRRPGMATVPSGLPAEEVRR